MAKSPKKLWPAENVEKRRVDSLTPYLNNARTHSAAQIKQLVSSIKEWGWTVPVLVDENGRIIAGHGRVLAAQSLKIAEVPVMVARGWTEAQKRAYVIADNQLALNAGWDEDLLRVELTELSALDFNLDLTGLSSEELGELFSSAPGGENDPAYSRKIVAPIYEPTGDKPAVGELFDDAKARALSAEIRAAALPADVAAFLEKAAERHTVFDFRRIADFYASSGPDVQLLMEKSALVIIDFNQAIENGFVQLTKRLGDLASKAEPAPDEE